MNTKHIVTGAFLSVLAALFQCMPALLSEVFIFMTIFSALPIFVISAINPKTGFISYIVAALIIMLVSVHESLFFLCSNGMIGFSLGTAGFFTKKRPLIWLFSSFTLTIALCVMNFGIGIPVFGTTLPGSIMMQLDILMLFAFIYSVIYYLFCSFILKLLAKFNVLEINKK